MKRSKTPSPPGIPLLIFSYLALFLLIAGAPRFVHASPIQVSDDNGQTLTLSRPARRIISLAPHITEMLYAAGAGRYIVGTIDHSDYPAEATRITRIGDYNSLDLEAILALTPDLIVAWPGGNPPSQLHKLRTLGLPIYAAEPRHLSDIPRDIEQLGRLAATDAQARQSAADFRHQLQGLHEHYQQRPPVTVFFQVWNQPLLTINGEHLINDVIRLCGGQNIFAGLQVLTPQVSIETVLQADPAVIITAADDAEVPAALQHWRHWPELAANRNHHLYGISPDQISRQGPRILVGARRLCERLEQVRQTQNKTAASAPRR